MMMKEKIKAREELHRIIKDLKAKGKKTVFTNGCFDLLHVGHIRYLEKAKSLGDILVVGLNSDQSVRTIKGPERPILPEGERAEVLSGLWCVDYITLFDESTPLELITSIKPNVLAKGGDWTKETTVGKDVVEGSGGEVVILPFVEGSSTTNIIETILKRFLEKSRNL
ncbi:MAG: D-glycero-beta-D-manno-heptose 1-phosphate adenylyltransferase [Deltaproteobacteria bacterium]|nr:D-glycero-beta-D-manno-heptose 1-phosphate adenylyltransferase [Deltaproteobacteria bacterium]